MTEVVGDFTSTSSLDSTCCVVIQKGDEIDMQIRCTLQSLLQVGVDMKIGDITGVDLPPQDVFGLAVNGSTGAKSEISINPLGEVFLNASPASFPVGATVRAGISYSATQ